MTLELRNRVLVTTLGLLTESENGVVREESLPRLSEGVDERLAVRDRRSLNGEDCRGPPFTFLAVREVEKRVRVLFGTQRRNTLVVLILAPLGKVADVTRERLVSVARPSFGVIWSLFEGNLHSLIRREVRRVPRELPPLRIVRPHVREAVLVVGRLTPGVTVVLQLVWPHDPLLDESENHDGQSRELLVAQTVDEHAVLVVDGESGDYEITRVHVLHTEVCHVLIVWCNSA